MSGVRVPIGAEWGPGQRLLSLSSLCRLLREHGASFFHRDTHAVEHCVKSRDVREGLCECLIDGR